jgi:hypothetical protein
VSSRENPPGAAQSPDERVRELEAELETLRTAHDAQARFLVQERLALADEIEREIQVLQEEIDWRKGVMAHQEEVILTYQNSRSLRYTEPLRKVARVFRRS